MPDQVTNYKCPACGGPLHYVGASGKLECDYCGEKYDVEAVEASLKDKNEKAAAAMGNDGWTVAESSESWGADGMKTYSCPSCGAELICDSNTAATCCPYCGNQTVIPGQFSGSLKPEFVIPFKTDKEQAKAALKNHYKGKRLLPNSFISGNHIEEIQGVYVPFWMFDCVAQGDVQFEASTSETKRLGNKEITTTRHYDVRRSGTLAFEKIPVDASTRMPDEHMDSIEPYDYKELKPFSMAYMPGFLADKYDVTAEACGRRMEERCEKTFMDEIDKTVDDYEKANPVKKNIRVQKGQVHYAMLPVWLLATKWNDQSFLFAMNGQSGKLVGDLPLDKGKYWGFFGGISAAIIAIMQILNFFVFSKPMATVPWVFVTILLPLLIGLLAVTFMKGSLSSVHKQKAADYITGMGLRLTDKQDIFLRTTTETKEVSTPSSNTTQK